MKQFNRSVRRVRKTRGSSFLTHGGDNYDHRGLNKARRGMNKALAQVGLEEWGLPESEPEVVENPVSWRIVVYTQVWENYGAHDWDPDSGAQCPRYWKAKGGDEYHLELGDLDRMLAISGEEVRELADRVMAKVTRNDEFVRENPVGWDVLSDVDESYEEQMDRESRAWGFMVGNYRAQNRRVTLD